MTTFRSSKMQTPFVINIISIRHYDDYKHGVGGTSVYLCKTWNLTSLIMDVKESWIASCVAMHFPP
jgi:hypothetical protein